MAVGIQTNFASLTAQRQLNNTSSGLNQALTRLSSGLRINGAKDDAAGQAIASRFTAQINGYNQGVRNAGDAISLAQTAEGALNEIVNNVQRIRELAVQSANASNSSADRVAIQTEVAQLQTEIGRVKNTEFNGKTVIGASAQAFAFQVGPNGGNTITVTTTDTSTLGGYTAVTGTGSVGTAAAATAMITNSDTLLASLNTQRATLGAVQNRFDSVIRNAENVSSNLQAARGRIQDADFASETASLTKNQILQQAGISVLSQANAIPQSALGLLG